MMDLKSGDVRIRDLVKDDAARMAILANNKKISQNLRDGFPNPYSHDDAVTFISNCMRQNPETIFAIEYKGDYVGNIALIPGVDVYRKSAEIGYFIGEEYWNKGITTIAVKLITDFAFNKLDFVRIHTGIFEYNISSLRVMEKCGYKNEGIFKKAVFRNNKLWDEFRYAIINSKYL